jgi:alpha-glucosidase
MTWWKSAVFYQLYPRSFSDSNGDGIGDLEGIRQRLDYLRWLGIDAIWLSPIYRSPMADFGYDVSDYTDINQTFGDLETFDRLLADAHRMGIRIMLDWVPNHSSDQHPWFIESKSSRDNPKRDWYLWRDPKDDGSPPNNWRALFGGPAWTWDEKTEQYYLHLFLPQQPDLNWANQEVVEAMHNVLRFWLDRGIDGFRADVVHLIGKDEALPDFPSELSHLDLVAVHEHPRTHKLLRDIRKVLDSYPGQRAIVGEINLHGAGSLAPYYGSGDELNMVFNFGFVDPTFPMDWDAEQWAHAVSNAENAFTPVDAWPVWVFSNHDNPRHRTRWGGQERRARLAAMILLTLRGTPFLYAGEELGLLDAEISDERKVDPGNRDGCRAPIPWDDSPNHGWEGDDPWLPWPPEVHTRNATAQQEAENSILNLYRRLLLARRSSTALQSGSWRLLDAPQDVLAYERRSGVDVRRIIANFSTRDIGDLTYEEDWEVDVGTELGRTGEKWDGNLRSEEAVIIRPLRRD